jgi:hypothetical protein
MQYFEELAEQLASVSRYEAQPPMVYQHRQVVLF